MMHLFCPEHRVLSCISHASVFVLFSFRICKFPLYVYRACEACAILTLFVSRSSRLAARRFTDSPNPSLCQQAGLSETQVVESRDNHVSNDMLALSACKHTWFRVVRDIEQNVVWKAG